MTITLNSFWLRVFGRAQATPVEHDPADMGTCFGLEMFLGEQQAPPAASAAAPTLKPSLRARWFPTSSAQPVGAD